MNLEAVAIARLCTEAVVDAVDHPVRAERSVPRLLDRLVAIAEVHAGQDSSIERLYGGVHQAIERAFDRITRDVTADPDKRLAVAARRLLELRHTLVTAVSRAIAEELSGGEETTGTHTRPVGAVSVDAYHADPSSRSSVAGEFGVLALAIPAHREELGGGQQGVLGARRKLRRVRAALAEQVSGDCTVALGPYGGTVLVPAASGSIDELRSLIDRLTKAAEVPVTAVVLFGPWSRVPSITEIAHDLLNVAQRLHYASGLYEFADLALEYQLTRPSLVQQQLTTALRALDAHPDLLETLVAHFESNLSRQRTATVLRVHRNTVDYRLKRIEEVTGYDPTDCSGIWYLQSVLVARAYRRVRDAPALVPANYEASR